MKILFILLLFGLPLTAQQPDAKTILQKVDQNFTAGTKELVAEMIIHGRRGARSVRSRSWLKGESKSFTEYLAPARDKGTKMLKDGDQLWTYSPQTDRIIRISGHLLRQSVMGSDLSYEDMMEDARLSDNYSAKLSGSETIFGRDCFILDLKAVNDNQAYQSRKIWVDQERMLILKEERFAKSGKLLKRTEVRDVKYLDDRWVPVHVWFKDMLKSGEGTEYKIEDIKFNIKIKDYLLTKSALRR